MTCESLWSKTLQIFSSIISLGGYWATKAFPSLNRLLTGPSSTVQPEASLMEDTG